LALSPEHRLLTLAELQERISARNEVPFVIWDGKVRMSVARYQDKLLVQHFGEQLFLGDGAQASTHILKPEPLNTAMPCMVANEHFCMKLASRLSLRRYGQDQAAHVAHVAHVAIIRAPDPVLAIQRFDRRRVPGRWVGGPQGVRLPAIERLHIIDGCQATDASVADKYERNMGNGRDVAHIRDGVGFSRLFALRPQLRQPAVGVRRMTLWAVTTLLTGNSDAHGKNIQSYALAPPPTRRCAVKDLTRRSRTQHPEACPRPRARKSSFLWATIGNIRFPRTTATWQYS